MIKERLSKAGAFASSGNDLPSIFEDALISMIQNNLKYKVKK
jgi:hypothetical protein